MSSCTFASVNGKLHVKVDDYGYERVKLKESLGIFYHHVEEILVDMKFLNYQLLILTSLDPSQTKMLEYKEEFDKLKDTMKKIESMWDNSKDDDKRTCKEIIDDDKREMEEKYNEIFENAKKNHPHVEKELIKDYEEEKIQEEKRKNNLFLF